MSSPLLVGRDAEASRPRRVRIELAPNADRPGVANRAEAAVAAHRLGLGA